MKRVLAYRDALRTHDRTPMIPWDGVRGIYGSSSPCQKVALSEVIWADDLSSCLEAGCAEDVAAEVSTETGILADAFAAHGLKLNFAPAKTSALLSVRGPGATTARHELFRTASLCVLRENDVPVHLPLVPRYRQVGVVHAPQGEIGPEIKQRAAEAWVVLWEGRRKVFRNQALPVTSRMALLRSLVLSKFLFSSGAWPMLNASDGRLFQCTVLRFYRRIVGPKHSEDQRMHQCEVCAKAEAAAPFALLHSERLRYLRQMVCHGPDALWALVRLDPSASEPLQQALAWLYARVPPVAHLREPWTHWDNWVNFMKGRPRCFKAMIRRGLQLDTLQQRCLAALSVLHRHLQDLNGIDLSGDQEVSLSDVKEACPICRVAFESRVAWSTHAMRLHGYRTRAAKLATGRTCLSCGKAYASEGLRNHLKAVPECCRQWGRFQPTDVEPAVHQQCPPLQRIGAFQACSSEGPGHACEDLHAALRALEARSSLSDFDLYDIVISFIAPLPTLRAEVVRWKSALPPNSALYEAADNVSLILTPQCVADHVKRTVHKRAPMMPHVPAWKPVRPLPRVMTGCQFRIQLRDPPSLSFRFPFSDAVGVPTARAVTLWVADACGQLRAAATALAERPATVHASPQAWSALGPVYGWLCDVGIQT